MAKAHWSLANQKPAAARNVAALSVPYLARLSRMNADQEF